MGGKTINSHFGLRRQTCKVCGCQDKFDFHVSDGVWASTVPARLQKQTICLSCFDDFALAKEIDYANSLQVLYFAGNRAVLKFQTVSAQSV
jgi:hypothetical protein